MPILNPPKHTNSMAKLILVCFLAFYCFALTSHAATYAVGDTSGWDISTDIDSWAASKRFNVGDVLLFQYSSSHSVDEVTKESFETCNTTNSLRTFSNGNTTVTLSNAGTKYFVCGNRLHCLGGMKLQVNVEGQASSPVGAPEVQPQPRDTTPKPSSKNDDPPTVIPSSDGFINGGNGSLILAFLFMASTALDLLIHI